MKVMFASDIHGSVYYCRELINAYQKSGASRLILLGDLLYHGPRNDLPPEYNPKQVAAMLNEKKKEIAAVRGNCDAEVDQMLLEFPVLAEYAMLMMEDVTFFLTHGHVFHKDNLPMMKAGDVLVHGHTHVLKAEKIGDYYVLNPGSVSIPKEGHPPTYAVYEDGMYTVLDFDGEIQAQMTIG